MAIAVVHLVGTAIAGLGLLLHIISIATTGWVVQSDVDYEVGLFKICVKSICVDIPETAAFPTDDIKAVRAMVLIGLIAAIVGLAFAILVFVFQLLNKVPNQLFFFAAAGLCILAAVCNFIGVIVFVAEIYEPLKSVGDLGFSFALCIVGFILFIIGGVFIGAGAKNMS